MEPIRILLTGAEGQLGKTIVSRWKEDAQIHLYPTDLPDLDITDRDKVIRAFREIKPDYCINTAAYTAVDRAENEMDKAFLINAHAVKNICDGCLAQRSTLIHFSTDYVYDSWPAAFLTEKAPNLPRSVYGKSKLQGDLNIFDSLNKYYILRISWLYSEFGNNFLKTIIRLSKTRSEIEVVDDQFGSPCYAEDLVHAVRILINHCQKGNPAYGVFNFSNQGVTSWHGFAEKILELTGMPHFPVKRISTEDFGALAPRPLNSKLSKKKFTSWYKFPVPAWQTSLEKCLQVMKSNNLV